MKFSDALLRAQGRPAGFDYMRLLLAISIIGFHSIVTCYGSHVQATALSSTFGWIFNLILPMFFALSGFLVAGSLERSTSIAKFTWLRVCRIYPALAVDTLLCALVLGPFLTSLSLIDYFSSKTTWMYFSNALGLIHFYLPGVFESNPAGKVNAQLWTIPVELECYLALGIFGLLRLNRRPIAFSLLAAGLCLTWGASGYLKTDANYIRTLVPGSVLIMSFLAGVSIFLLRNRLPYGKIQFSIAAAALLACLIEPRWVFFAPIPAAYATCYLGCLKIHRHWLIERLDVSYGLFLYGYPIQQTLVYVSNGRMAWYENIICALPITCALAWASLQYVERPAQQKMRNWIK